jgi:hypothetical protein
MATSLLIQMSALKALQLYDFAHGLCRRGDCLRCRADRRGVGECLATERLKPAGQLVQCCAQGLRSRLQFKLGRIAFACVHIQETGGRTVRSPPCSGRRVGERSLCVYTCGCIGTSTRCIAEDRKRGGLTFGRSTGERLVNGLSEEDDAYDTGCFGGEC